MNLRFSRNFAQVCMTFVFTFFFSTVKAQEITMLETLRYINTKLSPACSLDVVKGVIIAVYKEKGETVREDQASISDLDINSIKYDTESGIFSINCKGAPAKKCDTRDLPRLNVYRSYARISWKVMLDPKSAEGLKKAFTHLMKMVLDSKYKSSEPFE